MDLHNPSVRGHALLQQDPVNELHAVPKRYVDLRTAGGIFVTDIVPTSSGIVGLKEYHPDTVPADYFLSKAVTNTANVTVQFIAEPGMQDTSITAIIESSLGQTAIPVTNITAGSSPRVYQGSIDITVDDALTTDTLRLVSSTGAEVTVDLDILVGGPPVSSVTLGAYPGSQTAVKQGDTMTLTGVVRNDAESIRILNFGASGEEKTLSLGAEDSAGAGFRTFNGSFTVSNRSGSLPVRVVATNILGTDGDIFTSVDNADLDQTFPTFGTFSASYPASQEAIKGNETVNVDIPISNADDFSYSVASGLSIDSPTAYSLTKAVTRVDETIQYSVGSNNITVTATRTSNGAVTVRSFAVSVANAAPTAQIVIVGGSTLRSSPGGENYQVEIRSDQELIGQPNDLQVVANTGTLSGTWSRVNDSRYRTTLTVFDADTKGTHSFSSMVITGLAGVQGSTITSGANYTIAGITQRDLVVPALQQEVAIGTFVTDINNVVVSYKGADVLELRNDTTQYAKGFTITDGSGNYDPNGSHVFITDATFAGSNTSGTLVLEFEETV